MSAATALACPACGDPSPVPPGARVLACPACSVVLAVEEPPIPHVMVAALVTDAQATEAVRTWMHGVRHRELLAWRARLEPPRLVFLPFARVEATVLGQLYGRRKHVEEKRTYYTDEEIAIGVDSDVTTPLSDVGELGVERLPANFAYVTQVPFDETVIAARGAELVPALESDTTAADRAHAQFLATAHTGHNLETITGEQLSIVGARETRVHYPFWRVDYRFGRTTYTVVVDANSGEIAYGRAPGSQLVHSALFGLVMPFAAKVFLASVALALAIFAVAGEISDASDKIGGGVFAVGAVIGIAGCSFGGWCALVAHRGLRQSGEVESGYGAHSGAGLLDTKDAAYRAQRATEQAEVDADAALRALETGA